MFDTLEREQVGEVHLVQHPPSQLQAIIAIHSTRLGPALGGCRFIEYRHDAAALNDALRLARGMTYKAALAGLPYGGGKTVVLKPPGPLQRAALFSRLGEFIEQLGGRYITSLDAGTRVEDMDAIASATRWVIGTTAQQCDPSPYTALGVFEGIRAAVRWRWQRSSLVGLRIALQGLGHVGMALARRLHDAGAALVVSDADPARARRAQAAWGAEVVSTERILATPCDILAPCALGGVITSANAAQLRCEVVAGCANNQLQDPECAARLHRLGILYAPDYVINAGGLIRVALAGSVVTEAEIRRRTMAIGATLKVLFERAQALDLPPEQLAVRRAQTIIEQGGAGHEHACRAV